MKFTKDDESFNTLGSVVRADIAVNNDVSGFRVTFGLSSWDLLPRASIQVRMLIGICNLKLLGSRCLFSVFVAVKQVPENGRGNLRGCLWGAWERHVGMGKESGKSQRGVMGLSLLSVFVSVSFSQPAPSLPPQRWLLKFLEFVTCFRSPQISPPCPPALYLSSSINSTLPGKKISSWLCCNF